jgi:hypothetical protein
MAAAVTSSRRPVSSSQLSKVEPIWRFFFTMTSFNRWRASAKSSSGVA